MNTSKTYVAYDAAGVLDHRNSNLRTFRRLRDWERRAPGSFHFLNMGEIDYCSEHDDLVDSTLKRRLLQLMGGADNLLVLASAATDTESPVLNWQISRAVNRYHLPVVVAHVGRERLDEAGVRADWREMPAKVRKYIGLGSAFMAHVPLTKDKLERALGAYSVRRRAYPWDATTIF